LNRAEPNFKLVASHPQTLGEFGIALGTLDDDPGVRPSAMSLSAAKPVGSRLPMTCRDTTNFRRDGR
jgi:hypothetical protein